MRIPESPGTGIEIDVVDRMPSSYGQYADFALSLHINLAQVRCRVEHLWVEREDYEAFLNAFKNLARTRQGDARLRFLSGDRLEFFSVRGSSDLAVRGEFSWQTRIGSELFPTQVHLHMALDSEWVETVTTDLRRLLEEAGA